MAANSDPRNEKRYRVSQAALPGTALLFALLARSFFAQEEAASALAEATANAINAPTGTEAAKQCNTSIGVWNKARSDASVIVQQSIQNVVDEKEAAQQRVKVLEAKNKKLEAAGKK
jgi:hypothetical protein